MRALALIFAGLLAASPAAAVDRIEIAFQSDPTLQAAQASVVAVRNVIARQIDAVQKDDAKTAFSVVTPKLKEQFPNGKAYLQVIRSQFPAIAKAKLVSFGDLRETSFGTAQMVNLSDDKGEPWLAFFLMDQGKPGDWRISNVVMVKLPSTAV